MHVFRAVLRPAGLPLVSFVGLLTGLGCGLGDAGSVGAAGGPSVTVEAVTVKAGLLRDVETFSGQLSAEKSVMVKSEIEGVIDAVLFDEGQEVSEGQVLFRLKSAEQSALVREARANLALAMEVHDRTLKLAKRDAASEAAQQQAAAELAVARARVELAQVDLDRTDIRAPFDGVVGQRLVDPGDRVDTDTPLVEIDSVDRLQVSFSISELGILFTEVGTPVDVRVAPYPEDVFPARVFFVSPTLDPATRRITAKAWIDNADRRLRPGLFAEIDMQVAERSDAILVPESAVVFDRRGTYVWRLDEQRVATKVPVETGLRRDGRVEITLGLQPGERIVSAGTHKVIEGMEVSVAGEIPGARGQARRTLAAPVGDGA